MNDYSSLITVISLIYYIVLTFKVGQARGKYGVKAPATTGHEMFERALRVQMNMLEQMVFFLPSLWLFTIYLDFPKIAAGLGAVWLVGRILYNRSYLQGSNRGLGFGLSLLAASLLLIGGAAGVIMHLIAD